MNGITYTIYRCIDPNIKVGDKVYIYDGSGLTYHEDNKNNEDTEKPIIIYTYPKLTGSNSELRFIQATVLETNIQDKISMGVLQNVYLQDIIIQIGNAKFRTCSQFVTHAAPDPFDNDFMD